LEDGKPVPAASALDAVQPGQGGFVSLLALDMDEYAKKFSGKAIQKTLAIPAWLNAFAEANHIDFSQALQDSLVQMHQQQMAKA
jgi:hypothetical protein